MVDLYDHDLVTVDMVIGKTMIHLRDLEDGEKVY